jgi:hypothetical protein
VYDDDHDSGGGDDADNDADVVDVFKVSAFQSPPPTPADSNRFTDSPLTLLANAM